MWIVDLDKKVVHDMSRPQYECKISKIPKDNRKKIYTDGGLKRFFDDPLNKEYNGCRYCMPDFYEFDMTSIFRNN
ncbi:MAG: hypothetical protein MAG453_00046 [Calditrichaeota bacterium]|nr:hypothetical protein [Calditrichota bacterium]